MDKDMYFVAVKVFLVNEGRLFIFKDRFGDWDLPGGRIRKDEFDVPLDKVIERKMREELGGDVTYAIGKPVVLMRHERVEHVLTGLPADKRSDPTVRIFAVGYEGTLTGGDIHLSPLHTEMLWVDPKTFKPEDYFTGGWLKGVKEYLDLRHDG